MLEDLATDAIEGVIWNLWQPYILRARDADNASAKTAEALIVESRKIIAEAGHAKDSDLVLFSVYIKIHWDCARPTDRVFETMLGFELENFFKEGMS